MLRLINICWIGLVLVCGKQTASAFSLIGPLEDWQTTALGYDTLGSDIGGPKNIHEEYRWNTPVITYGFDAHFIDYFGSNGVAAIDAAMAIFNALPAASTISPDLREFPLKFPPGDPAAFDTTYRDARRVNLRAQALGLVDLKSLAMGLVIEELGLASPERWVWALRDRKLIGNPAITNYLTIQRNFDPKLPESPSKYVNGTRYTYQIFEFENPVNFADAVEMTIDPSDPDFTAVASISGFLFDTGLDVGTFYTSLTQDDIGGLRYLYHPENVNIEPFPANTQIFVADRTNSILLTNMDLTLLSARSLTNSPAQISNFYPGIIISQAIPRATNIIRIDPVVTTQQVTLAFFTNTALREVVTNIDLHTFSSISLTSPPAVLLQQFPNLIITRTNTSFTTRVDIASITITNGPKFPWGDPFQTNFIFVTNFFTNLAVNFHYAYSNVVTNFSSPVTQVRREVFGFEREPWGDPLSPTFRTNVTTFLEPRPSGGIIILPPGIAGYEFIGPNTTNILVNTNILFLTNFVANGVLRAIGDIEYRFVTNVQYGVFPIQYLPAGLVTNIFSTNFVTNITTAFDMRFANVITNYSGPVTPAVEYNFTIRTNPFAPQLLTTNVTSNTFTIPLPSGGFLIDTNLTGYEFTGFAVTNLIPVTNVVFDITNPGIGERRVQEIVYIFTNVIYNAFPFVLTDVSDDPFYRPGVDKITFLRIGTGTIPGQVFNFTNRYQAVYFTTNGVKLTNTFQVVQNRPDILFTGSDLGTLNNSVRPVQSARSAGFVNNSTLDIDGRDEGGPGNIVPPITITFNTIGHNLINQAPNIVDEASALRFGAFQPFIWGSFDGSTNAPIVYPKTFTIQELEDRVLSGSNP